MNKAKVKKEVQKFLRQINHSASLTNLQQHPEYNIYFYNSENLDNDRLLTAIGETDYAKTVNSFCLERDGQKIVFVNNSIDYQEKVFLILHEIGHLVMEHHKNQDAYFTVTLEQEQEANFFAESIYMYDKNKLVKRNILLTGILTAIVAIGSSYFLVNHAITTKANSMECFITATGKRYHFGCDHLQDNYGVIWTTVGEAREKGCTPCKDCVPEKYR